MAEPAPVLRSTLRLPAKYDFKGSLDGQRMAYDPTMSLTPNELWRSAQLPSGAATLHVTQTEPGQVEVEAWGPGAEAMVEACPKLLGLHDNPGNFQPEYEPMQRMLRKRQGLHMPTVPDPFRILVQVILGQRVRWQDAARSFERLVRKHGSIAPGPNSQLMIMPEARYLSRLPSHEYASVGVEQQRARIIVRVAQSHRRITEVLDMTPEDAKARLRAFPGVGPWTEGMICVRALGLADTVPTGDLKLPHLVIWGLTGEARGDDDRMVELLEPFRPHRWRVIQLLETSGKHPPKFGPRARLGPSPGGPK